RLSPYTRRVADARKWLARAGGGSLDGVIAKFLDQPYQPGERAMLKIKCIRTADCVVGGFRYASGSRDIGSLLLGLYNSEGRLDHIGFTSAISASDQPALKKKLVGLRGGSGFSGDAPGGPSRWSTERSGEWLPLKPKLVVEVRYDHVTAGASGTARPSCAGDPTNAPNTARLTRSQKRRVRENCSNRSSPNGQSMLRRSRERGA